MRGTANLLNIGTEEKTENSRYQILIRNCSKPFSVANLIEEKDCTGRTMYRPDGDAAINRFFDTKEDRDTYIQILEQEIRARGGFLRHNEIKSCPYFVVFDVYDAGRVKRYSLTVYI